MVRTLLRPARLLAPLNGSDQTTPAIGDFYFRASNGSVTLPASRYDYNSDWTPLLAGLPPAGTAASFAAPASATERTLVYFRINMYIRPSMRLSSSPTHPSISGRCWTRAYFRDGSKADFGPVRNQVCFGPKLTAK